MRSAPRPTVLAVEMSQGLGEGKINGLSAVKVTPEYHKRTKQIIHPGLSQ